MIQHKETNEFWSTKSRSMWETESAAKGSFTKRYDRYNKIKFDEQDKYEIIEYVLVEKEEYDAIEDLCDEAEKLAEVLNELPIDWRKLLE